MNTRATPPVTQRMLEHIQISDAAMRKAAALEQALEDQATKRASAIPRVVELLVNGNYVRPDERVKLAEVLNSPDGALTLLERFAERRPEPAVPPLGSPVKTASAGPGASPFVGARNPAVRASDAALFAGLGLPVPAA